MKFYSTGGVKIIFFSKDTKRPQQNSLTLLNFDFDQTGFSFVDCVILHQPKINNNTFKRSNLFKFLRSYYLTEFHFLLVTHLLSLVFICSLLTNFLLCFSLQFLSNFFLFLVLHCTFHCNFFNFNLTCCTFCSTLYFNLSLFV